MKTAVGSTSDPSIGNSQGIVGILTQGRKTRKDYIKDAIYHGSNPRRKLAQIRILPHSS